MLEVFDLLLAMKASLSDQMIPFSSREKSEKIDNEIQGKILLKMVDRC